MNQSFPVLGIIYALYQISRTYRSFSAPLHDSILWPWPRRENYLDGGLSKEKRKLRRKKNSWKNPLWEVKVFRIGYFLTRFSTFLNPSIYDILTKTSFPQFVVESLICLLFFRILPLHSAIFSFPLSLSVGLAILSLFARRCIFPFFW